MEFLNKNYVVAIGGTNIDIIGKSFQSIILDESNPSEINYSPGGVIRNIAENISLLKNECYLISVFGDDHFGNFIKTNSIDAGINIQNSLTVQKVQSSSYISVHNKNGEMFVALSNTDILDHLTPEFLEKKTQLITKASIIVIDANLSDKTLKYIFKKYSDKVIFADPVSVKKARKLKSYVNRIHALKPNTSETKILFNLEKIDKRSLKTISDTLTKKGIKRLLISLGQYGAISYNNGIIKNIFLPNTSVKNVTGAGDALLAGLIHGYLKNWSWDYSVIFSLAMANVSTQSSFTINKNITEKKIKKYIKDNKIK